MTWQHFHYGLVHIGREQMRMGMLIAQAVRHGGSEQQSFNDYQSDVQRMTEVPRG